MTMMTCLNPYYTGIHLHNVEDYEEYRDQCLNPYYTGIHLHVIWERLLEVPASVLILIILEYIYIAL